jgi:hypothetical protein
LALTNLAQATQLNDASAQLFIGLTRVETSKICTSNVQQAKLAVMRVAKP